MALLTWKQTFRKNGVIQRNAGVSIYFAATTDPVRVFDINSVLRDTDPQVHTDSAGFAQFSLDPDDFSSGQLFDILAEPNAICQTCDDIWLKNMMLLQDTEGNRSFKQIYAQDDAPTEGMREGDLFFDTDDNNHPYRFDGTSWTSSRDGSIAVAGTTANWSGVVDDNSYKPSDDVNAALTENASTATNLVGNGSYELLNSATYPIMWQGNGTYVATGGHNSNRYMSLEYVGSELNCYQHGVEGGIRYTECIPGEKITLGASLKRISGGATARFRISFRDKDKAYVSGADVTSTSATWETKSTTATIPATAVFMQFLSSAITGAGVVGVDNCWVSHLVPAEEGADVTAGQSSDVLSEGSTNFFAGISGADILSTFSSTLTASGVSHTVTGTLIVSGGISVYSGGGIVLYDGAPGSIVGTIEQNAGNVRVSAGADIVLLASADITLSAGSSINCGGPLIPVGVGEGLGNATYRWAGSFTTINANNTATLGVVTGTSFQGDHKSSDGTSGETVSISGSPIVFTAMVIKDGLMVSHTTA